MVSTSTEARDSFVAHTQSDKCGLIKVEGKPGFGSRAIFVDQATVDADDFQGALFEVMCFLGVQSQDLPRYLAFQDDQGRDGLSPKSAHGLEAMPAIGGPEATAGRQDCDDRIEKTPSPT